MNNFFNHISFDKNLVYVLKNLLNYSKFQEKEKVLIPNTFSTEQLIKFINILDEQPKTLDDTLNQHKYIKFNLVAQKKNLNKNKSDEISKTLQKNGEEMTLEQLIEALRTQQSGATIKEGNIQYSTNKSFIPYSKKKNVIESHISGQPINKKDTVINNIDVSNKMLILNQEESENDDLSFFNQNIVSKHAIFVKEKELKKQKANFISSKMILRKKSYISNNSFKNFEDISRSNLKLKESGSNIIKSNSSNHSPKKKNFANTWQLGGIDFSKQNELIN